MLPLILGQNGDLAIKVMPSAPNSGPHSEREIYNWLQSQEIRGEDVEDCIQSESPVWRNIAIVLA